MNLAQQIAHNNERRAARAFGEVDVIDRYHGFSVLASYPAATREQAWSTVKSLRDQYSSAHRSIEISVNKMSPCCTTLETVYTEWV